VTPYPTTVCDRGAGPAVVLAATLRMIAGFDLGDGLAALPVPGRFVAAEHDLVAAPDDLRAAAATLPDGEFLLERGANHMLPVEHPERLAALDW
jgi:pimeloyl-ACP methyl ester carboxylesterase